MLNARCLSQLPGYPDDCLFHHHHPPPCRSFFLVWGGQCVVPVSTWCPLVHVTHHLLVLSVSSAHQFSLPKACQCPMMHCACWCPVVEGAHQCLPVSSALGAHCPLVAASACSPPVPSVYWCLLPSVPTAYQWMPVPRACWFPVSLGASCLSVPAFAWRCPGAHQCPVTTVADKYSLNSTPSRMGKVS